ncbi:MAG TPA: hypothetical protein VHZ51_18415 [Ktedonobacteraceae bacterium]|jgi:hypothetical protein|nr:hypothetical protein [Ktedonobacteraceae bacterium]
MKHRCVAVLLLSFMLASSLLTACSPGHLGSNVIAFLRSGHLWTSDPDGANAFEVVAQGTPVISYAWSPDHHLLAFRQLDPDFAKTAASHLVAANAVTGQLGDAPSTLNTIGVDGGSPITIAFSSPTISYGAPLWNPAGSRLLYRQTPLATSTPPLDAHWWVSQNDQPGGIAIKSLPNSYSIPSMSYHTSNDEAVGNSPQGLFTTTLAGTQLHTIQQKPLAGHPLPATLERVLWQPAHQNGLLLYALPAPSSNTHASRVQLILSTPGGQTTPIATCSCSQFAWSPDGNSVLYTTNTTYTITNIKTHSAFTVENEANSVPYWSPDSQRLLLDGPQKLVLIQVATRQHTTLLTTQGNVNTTNTTNTSPAATTSTLLQPVNNSIWAADSHHFLFLTHHRLLWQGHALPNEGLYTVTIDAANGQPQGQPTLADKGNDSQAGWSYQDPNTSFLY